MKERDNAFTNKGSKLEADSEVRKKGTCVSGQQLRQRITAVLGIWRIRIESWMISLKLDHGDQKQGNENRGLNKKRIIRVPKSPTFLSY